MVFALYSFRGASRQGDSDTDQARRILARGLRAKLLRPHSLVAASPSDISARLSGIAESSTIALIQAARNTRKNATP